MGKGLRMTECSGEKLVFNRAFGRGAMADSWGRAITSGAGGLLLREADRRLGMTEALSGCIEDRRQAGKRKHSTPAMLRQRIYAVALGHVAPATRPWREDLNDHDQLRHDELMKLLGDCEKPPASSPPLCRLPRRESPPE